MSSDTLPPHAIGLVAPPGLSYNVRLVIASDGTTRERNDARAAVRAANVLTRGYSHLRMRPPLVRVPVRYGGAPGVLIRNLPGQPTLVIVVVLAHHGVLYRIDAPGIVAPGAALALDQRRALNSLRFIRRVGPFPSPTRTSSRSKTRVSSCPTILPRRMSGAKLVLE